MRQRTVARRRQALFTLGEKSQSNAVTFLSSPNNFIRIIGAVVVNIKHLVLIGSNALVHQAGDAIG